MRINKKQKGFTLLETLFVIGIFTIISMATSSIIIQTFKTNQFATEQASAIEHAKKGTDIMIKEIRESSPSENGSYPIESAYDQDITFYSDTDSDELVEKIRYYLDGTDLIKEVTDPTGFPPVYTEQPQTTIISKYVQNESEPIFYYYNGNYPIDTTNNPLSTPANVNQIRLVRVYLKININPEKAPQHFILISNSQIRNLKDNL